jgi:hypothetical protein
VRAGTVTDADRTAVFARLSGHEQVVFCSDPPTGLRAIIAIYSTALGPALGGTRCYPYATESEALDDVLNLSRAMTYKAALTGLDLGGGKAVIIGDPAVVKTEALLRAYGRFIASLGGRYLTSSSPMSAPRLCRRCGRRIRRSPSCATLRPWCAATSTCTPPALSAAR